MPVVDNIIAWKLAIAFQNVKKIHDMTSDYTLATVHVSKATHLIGLTPWACWLAKCLIDILIPASCWFIWLTYKVLSLRLGEPAEYYQKDIRCGNTTTWDLFM